MNTIKILKTVAIIIFIVYLAGLSFDVFVSYNYYNKNPQFFLCLEKNYHMVAELEKGFAFFKTNTIGYIILITLTYPLITYFLINEIKKTKNKFLKYPKIFCLGLVMVIYIYLTYIHFKGGLSWL